MYGGFDMRRFIVVDLAAVLILFQKDLYMEKFDNEELSAAPMWWQEDYDRACTFLENDSPEYDVDRGIMILADIYSFYSVQTIMEKLAIYAVYGNEAAIAAMNEWFMKTKMTEGCYVPEDGTQLVQWIRIVAQSGNPMAQNEMGCLYYNGIHVNQNYDTAARWFASGAPMGDEQISYNFAEVYLTGKTTVITESEASEPLYYAARYGCEPAQEWLQKTAVGGLANAQFFLGALIAQGQGDYEQDVETGMCWLHKAADQDFRDALNALAAIYRTGVLVPQDLPKCIALLQRAVEIGDMDAQDALGTMYDEGEGVLQDHARAVQMYEQSALQGEVSAMVRLAKHYLQGLGTTKDLSKAEYWFRLAVSKDSGEGLLGLAMVNEAKGNLEEAVDAYADALGNSECIEFFCDDHPEYWLEEIDVKMSPGYKSWCCKLSSCKDDKNQEEQEIRTYDQLLDAAHGGDAKAQHDLGYHYYWGGENYEQDIAQAIHWFGLAANNGHAQSAYNLGILYAEGEEDLTQDLELACRWFRKAMELIGE